MMFVRFVTVSNVTSNCATYIYLLGYDLGCGVTWSGTAHTFQCIVGTYCLHLHGRNIFEEGGSSFPRYAGIYHTYVVTHLNTAMRILPAVRTSNLTNLQLFTEATIKQNQAKAYT
jgi:hypothetical protein